MKKFLKALLIVGVLIVAGVTVAMACQPEPKVTLCHATPPETAANGWNDITIAPEAVFNAGHDGHAMDIIPSFEYTVKEQQCGWEWKIWRFKWVCKNVDVTKQYEGKNLNTDFDGFTGQQILDNGCEVPYTPCDQTVPFEGQWSDWVKTGTKRSDWVDNGSEWERIVTKYYERTRVVGLVDARDETYVCNQTVTTEYKQETKTQTKPYDACYKTVDGDVEFGDWYAVTEPSFNDWVLGDNDTRTRTGSQLMARDWTQNVYDINDGETICDVNSGTQQRGQLLREEENAPCDGMYLFIPATVRDYPCFLNRNPLTDNPWELPERFNFTEYMYDQCSTVYHCDGVTTGEQFNGSGEWQFVCDYGQYKLDCEGNVCK